MVKLLLRQYAETIDALRLTGVVRTKNNPVADYAEWLVARALGLELVPKSATGHDAIGPDGRRYEVKARRITRDNGSRQLSAIRKLDEEHFDWLVGVLFERDFSVLRAAKIPRKVVCAHVTFSAHTNASKFLLRDQVWMCDGVEDVTDAVRAAADSAET
jgi:hypothetical protein